MKKSENQNLLKFMEKTHGTIFDDFLKSLLGFFKIFFQKSVTQHTFFPSTNLTYFT
jgi:hypothetical protein